MSWSNDPFVTCSVCGGVFDFAVPEAPASEQCHCPDNRPTPTEDADVASSGDADPTGESERRKMTSVIVTETSAHAVEAILRSDQHPPIVAYVDSDTVDGICEYTVNGRDIEDGLAPCECIASILSKKLYIGVGEELDTLQMPELPGWLDLNSDGAMVHADGTQVDPVAMYSLTPLVVALANLPMFGGEIQTLIVTGK